MERADRRHHLAVRHLDADPGRLQGLDLGRPLVDDGDIVARLRQVGGNAAADGAGAQYGYLFFHLRSLSESKHDCARMDAR
ncbi:hypothetical protein D3C83_185600 [compost metagenome]